MRKLYAMLLALVMCLSICACNGDKAGSSQTLADKIEARYEEDPSNIIYKLDWFEYSWLTKNLNSFKDPASVELTGNVYYAKDEATSEIKFILIEARANNSFGGKAVGYVKVTATSLTQTNWTPSLVSPNFEGEGVWRSSISTYNRRRE